MRTRLAAAAIALLALAGGPSLRTLCLWSCEPQASMPAGSGHCHEDMAAGTRLSSSHGCPNDATNTTRVALRVDPVSVIQPAAVAGDPAQVIAATTVSPAVNRLSASPPPGLSLTPLRI